jgi:hypothetical protein
MQAEKCEQEVVQPLNLPGFNVVDTIEKALAMENNLLSGLHNLAEGQHLTQDPGACPQSSALSRQSISTRWATQSLHVPAAGLSLTPSAVSTLLKLCLNTA